MKNVVENECLEVPARSIDDCVIKSSNDIAVETNSDNMLLSEEEKQLFLRLAQGDSNAKTEIVEKYFKMVNYIAKRYINEEKGLEFKDLVQEGKIGLIKAIDEYDLSYNCKFSTYAFRRIRQAIQKSIPNMIRGIRIPNTLYYEFQSFIIKVKTLESIYGFKLTSEEIAIELGMDKKKCQKLLDLKHNVISYNVTANDNKEEFQSLFPDLHISVEDQTINRIIDSESIQLIMLKLEKTPRNREILFDRYGIRDGIYKKRKEVAEKFNISQQRVAEIESNLIKSLRKAVADYMNNEKSSTKIKKIC